ncbi:MAG: DUF58 domain-containing protein [Haloarculaceae archaeon]
MDATRRYWGQATVAGLLAGGAVLLARPLLLVGAAGLGAWLLAKQGRFARQIARIEAGLTVRQSLGREVVTVDEEVAVSLVAELENPVDVDLAVSATPPVGSSGPALDERRVTITAGERSASTTFLVRPEAAGRQPFDRATVTIGTDLFASTYLTGATPSLVVQPRRPRDVYIGAGGTRTVSSFAESVSGRRSSGLEPAGIRQYIVGDTVSRIDWKTTARLRQPHVVEFEAETDVRTTLVVDHRATMGLGLAGERKLDYARQLALTSLEAAREAHEPMGLLCVGDHGLTTHLQSGSTPSHYTKLRTRLHDLAPTEETTPSSGRTAPRGPAAAQRMAKRLRREGSEFASRLVPFLSEAGEYVRRLGADPLYATVRTELERTSEADVIVFLTDDEHRTEVYEAVGAARGGDNRVVVFLLPSVLFEPGGLTDLDDAYERYVEFDRFRRDLAALDGVTAFEVGPHDRVEALGRHPRRRTRA